MRFLRELAHTPPRLLGRPHDAGAGRGSGPDGDENVRDGDPLLPQPIDRRMISRGAGMGEIAALAPELSPRHVEGKQQFG